MSIQRFLARVGGFTEQVFALVTSTGVADAGKIVATDATGKLDASLMPAGIGGGAVPIVGISDGVITAGSFVSFYASGGVLSVKLASNTDKPADGYVTEDYVADDPAEVYPLDDTNSHLTGLSVGSTYWLGEGGAVIDVPLDESLIGNVGKYSQQLGIAISATELRTSDYSFVKL